MSIYALDVLILLELDVFDVASGHIQPHDQLNRVAVRGCRRGAERSHP